MKKQMTGILFDSRYLNHRAGEQHPECAERLERTMSYLEGCDWFAGLQRITPVLADESWIETVHRAEYIRHAQETCLSGSPFLDTPDVGVVPDSFEIARLAAGGALELADKLVKGQIRNGFALVRPPGHHAEEAMAMGFCLFNNIAILAKYLQKKHGFQRIFILDWDVHHGNGTQHTFEDDASVFYASLHQYPFYPGTGAYHEKGTGQGRGTTLNCPMAAGDGDKEYKAAFEEQVLPAARAFKPDIVLISAGFDAHAQDPLGSVRLSTEFYGWMTDRMLEIAQESAQGRLLSILEGGYNLNVLPLCIGQHLEVLSGVNKK